MDFLDSSGRIGQSELPTRTHAGQRALHPRIHGHVVAVRVPAFNGQPDQNHGTGYV